jgi:hypothetical protein
MPSTQPWFWPANQVRLWLDALPGGVRAPCVGPLCAACCVGMPVVRRAGQRAPAAVLVPSNRAFLSSVASVARAVLAFLATLYGLLALAGHPSVASTPGVAWVRL